MSENQRTILGAVLAVLLVIVVMELSIRVGIGLAS